MTNEAMKNIEKSIKDMLAGLQSFEDNKTYAYHHKIEYKYNLILVTADNIKHYRNSDK